MIAAVLSGLFVTMEVVAKGKKEGVNIDDGNPYLAENHPQSEGNQTEKDKEYINGTTFSENSLGIYERIAKPIIDTILSFLGLVLLSPVFAFISIAIFFDDPGSIFFTQKRVGRDKRFFFLHNVRAMKIGTAGSLENKGFLGDIDEKSFQNLIIFGHKVEHKVA